MFDAVYVLSDLVSLSNQINMKIEPLFKDYRAKKELNLKEKDFAGLLQNHL